MSLRTDRELRPHPAALRLRAALESLVKALASVQLDALLASETDVADALSQVSRASASDEWDRAATARELVVARGTLMRCRRLGSTLGEVTRISLAAQGRQPGYGRRNEGRGSVHSLEAKA